MNKTSDGLVGTLMIILLIVGIRYINPQLLAGLVFTILFLHVSYRTFMKSRRKLTLVSRRKPS